jgi:putative tryptophan/tyrosine transport system substrate-binding protein
MRRRYVMRAIAGLAAVWPLAAQGQQAALPVVGFLNAGSPAAFSDLESSFRKGLNDAGYVEGKNVAIEYRWAEGRHDRIPALAADLVNRPVAVIASTGGTDVVQTAAAATATIPIVFLGSDLALKMGIIASLNRPSRNVTGIAMSVTALLSKCLQFLSELVPKDAVIGVLVNPSTSITSEDKQDVQAAAQQIGRQIFILAAGNEIEIENAFATLSERHAGGLVVQGDALYANRRNQLVALAARHSLPTIYLWSEFTAAGGLITYGNSLKEGYQQVGNYVGRILDGAKPADLPVMQPARFRFTINLKTAKTLGLAIPPSLLILADEVIE